VTFPDEVLMAYADDQLDARTRAAVETAMSSDPEIARRIAQHRALRHRVESAFNRVLGEPVPPRLLRAVHGKSIAQPAGNVVPLQRRRVQRWAWPQWTAIAASLIVGVIAGRLTLLRAGNAGPTVMRDGRMLASGALADALSGQLAADQPSAAPVRIGVSFRSKAGRYCRTFTLREPASGGLACRAPDGWEVDVLLARGQSENAGSGAYRQAASVMSPALAAAVSERIVGEPLDARAEAAARDRHWLDPGARRD
jgi:anti-sigma factor RsiW